MSRPRTTPTTALAATEDDVRGIETWPTPLRGARDALVEALIADFGWVLVAHT